MLLAILVLLANTCVKAEGGFLPAYLFNEEASTGDALAASRGIPQDVQDELEEKAERIANAACDNDGGMFSTIGIWAYLDGTAVEIASFQLSAILGSRSATLDIVKAFAPARLRPDDPVVVRLMPVRAGGDVRARAVAVIRPGKEPEFPICSDPGCRPAPPPKRPAKK